MGVGVAGGGAGAHSIIGVGTDRGVKVGTVVGSGMGDANTTTACVTSGRVVLITAGLVTVGASVKIGNDVALGSA